MKKYICDKCENEVKEFESEFEEKVFLDFEEFSIAIRFKAHLTSDYDKIEKHICRKCINKIVAERLEIDRNKKLL